ncbi:MAG: hypothetical protein NTW29_02050 [Bacteroidetes bacterium]|nr:hypothetical protein [Bacteroidota bacterium]
MSKESSRKCPDCDGEDFYAFFGGKGDGNCSNCHGKGEVWSIGEGLEVFRLDLEKVEACKTCNATGQCQTCGGTGYEYYDDYDTSTPQSMHSGESSSYDDSYSSSYDHRYSDNSSKTTDSGSSFFSAVLGVVTLVIIYCLLQEFVCNNGSKNLQENNRYQRNESKVIWLTCDQCNGRGSINKESSCMSCSESGVIVCKSCNGKGDRKCDYFYCAGKGYFVCTGCDGEGEFGGSAHIKCDECNGTGRMTCPNCIGTGRDICSTCSGKKELKCNVCSGIGKIVSNESCPGCNGIGQVKQ